MSSDRPFETKTIGGFSYRMQKMGAITGRGIVLRLARPFANMFTAAASMSDKAEKWEKIAAGVGAAVSELSEEDFTFVSDRFMEHTFVSIPDSGRVNEFPLKDVFDAHFAGRYVAMLEWMAWGIQFNAFFGDALPRMVSALKRQDKASASSSPPASTGGPGDSSTSAS